MARTESNEFKIGEKAPDFNLINTIDDEIYALNDLKGDKGTVIMFICNHCPFVIHVNAELVKMANEYEQKGIRFIAISSNDVENYPQDAPHLMKELAAQEKYSFPYLYDETQEVAKAYNAACTPDFYVFDADLKSVYHGQLDDSRPGNGKPVTGIDLRKSLNNILENKNPTENQKPSVGCGIKWKINLN
ncbi:thioredoxin family protein [Polaribacter reichenbachii]|uniref:Alkyl hydroperoxide reductase n=1 Tax=Polaribacter reichenbachii TaxID=996801 RepID=A0A1B8TS71_9FLAO|nr:thioredoxin family protein [Polaribacter reichenbachii]APZ44982.1 thioredoxin family protein [Polaribacter reichenbachii]AUC18845.1 thioredoxin family protein [Polaribacter reichenbachii]OBY62324.1 alkyl hydroperoxide reductase [Polaribacter reichenbachii]